VGIINDKLDQWYRLRLESQLEYLVPQTIKEIEVRFKFQYNNNPVVNFDMPPDLISPNNSRLSNALFRGGIYDSRTNEIHINPDSVWPHKSGIIDTLLIYLNQDRWFIYIPDLDLKQVLAHELGHCHNHELLKSEGRDLLEYRLDKKYFEFRGFIEEGISVFIANEICNTHYEMKLNRINPEEIPQQYGYQLVKPILEKHSRTGIIHLLNHDPTKKELGNPKLYQERILAELS